MSTQKKKRVYRKKLALLHPNTIKRKKAPSNNDSLINSLAFLTSSMESILGKDFRHLVFDPIKSKDGVARVGESQTLMYKEAISVYSKQELLQLLKQKLLKHKWGDAAILLEQLALLTWRLGAHGTKPKQQYVEILQRAGREVFLNHPASCLNENLLSAQRQSLRFSMNLLDPSQIAIEDSFYLFSKLDFDGAKEKLAVYDVINKSSHIKEKLRIMALNWSTVAEAYMGLADYCTWRMNIGTDESTSYQDSNDSVSNAPELIKIAGEAIGHFQPLTKKKGCWDIFILKHLEILMHYYKFEMLQNDLFLYSKSHLSNPNAHKYFYLYLRSYADQNNDATDSLKLTALRNLYDVSPSDILMIDFHNMLFHSALAKSEKSSDNFRALTLFEESLEVLMRFLDYSSNKNSIKAWCCLHKILNSLKDRLSQNILQKLIKNVWEKSGRETWWPYFHFTKYHANQLLLSSFDEYKEAKLHVASVFMGVNCTFVVTLN